MDKADIIDKLQKSGEEVYNWVANQDIDRFSQGPEGKWDTSQHLDHLIGTTNAIIKGLKIPGFYLNYKFGRPNRPLRTYDEIVNRYQEKLLTIPPGMPSPITVHKWNTNQKDQALIAFIKGNNELIKRINSYSDKKLDNRLLPHPLMGRMIIRELLMWTSYHHHHHLKILKEKY